MSDALEGHKASVSNGGRIFKNFRFADEIASGAEEEQEAVDIVTSWDITCIRYKIEIGLNFYFAQHVIQTIVIHTSVFWR